MPKMKTKRAAAKRFRANAAGKFVHGKGYSRHNTGKKSGKSLRQVRGTQVVAKADAGLVKGMLPYRKTANS